MYWNAGLYFELKEVLQYCELFFMLLNLFFARFTICGFYIFAFFSDFSLKLPCMLPLLPMFITTCITVSS